MGHSRRTVRTRTSGHNALEGQNLPWQEAAGNSQGFNLRSVIRSLTLPPQISNAGQRSFGQLRYGFPSLLGKHNTPGLTNSVKSLFRKRH